MPITYSYGYPEPKPAARNYWEAVAHFSPPVTVTKETIERGGLHDFIDVVYDQVGRTLGDFISRRGRRSGVTAWQMVIVCRVYKENEPVTLDPLDTKIASSPVYPVPGITFKPFFYAALGDCIVGSGDIAKSTGKLRVSSGVLGGSAGTLAIFQLQVRAYRPSGPRKEVRGT